MLAIAQIRGADLRAVAWSGDLAELWYRSISEGGSFDSVEGAFLPANPTAVCRGDIAVLLRARATANRHHPTDQPTGEHESGRPTRGGRALFTIRTPAVEP